MPDILHLVRIRANPERVYEALTTTAGVRGWWTRDADLDATVGGSGTFRFYGGHGVTIVRLDELVPARRVAWSVQSANAPGDWTGTTIAFDLRAEDDVTVLAFAHRGFAQPSEGYAQVNTGWAYFLVSLRQYVETGSGGPHPDIDFSRMIRNPNPE
jgi:uncharacterized protein YndB with AHSA1/START domain